MSREIKFRAWDIEKKQMFQVEDIYLYTKKQIIGMQGELSYANKEPTKYFGEGELEQVKLMQYTGLKDKNGVEIYEGDIVGGGWFEIQGPEVIVKYNIIIDGKKIEDTVYVPYHNFKLKGGKYQYEELEVIGNIYTNPELLG